MSTLGNSLFPTFTHLKTTNMKQQINLTIGKNYINNQNASVEYKGEFDFGKGMRYVFYSISEKHIVKPEQLLQYLKH